ncbi:MAG: hypothetical protein DCC68_17310 [Planctomycetota bacterium]|nr:MAG: hypothetical protein DCC68_17310 [Planctomycetota bacterium]
MRYTVTWDRDAEAELTQLWLDAPDRAAIAAAANAIDRELAVDAERRGEEFYGDRLLVVRPLCVTFRVLPRDNLVIVRQVSRLAPT